MNLINTFHLLSAFGSSLLCLVLCIQFKEDYRLNKKWALFSSGIVIFLTLIFGLIQPYPDNISTYLEMLIIGPLVFLCITDIKALELPNRANLIIGILGGIHLLLTPLPFFSGLTSGIILFVSFFFIALLSGGALGGGDIKYVLAFGLWISPKLILPFLLFATFSASIYGILAILISKKKEPLPFGPFLIFSSIYILSIF